MARQIELALKLKGVRAVATLLEEEAPRTCNAVWDALPIEGETYHAKWAGRELYTLTPPFGDPFIQHRPVEYDLVLGRERGGGKDTVA